MCVTIVVVKTNGSQIGPLQAVGTTAIVQVRTQRRYMHVDHRRLTAQSDSDRYVS